MSREPGIGPVTARYQELIAELREKHPELDDLADELSTFEGSQLMRQADEAVTRGAEVDAMRADIERLQFGIERDKAFKQYGLDLERLKPLERAALEAYDGELTAFAVADFVSENNLPVTSARSQLDE